MKVKTIQHQIKREKGHVTSSSNAVSPSGLTPFHPLKNRRRGGEKRRRKGEIVSEKLKGAKEGGMKFYSQKGVK